MAIPIIGDLIKGIGLDKILDDIVVDKDKRNELRYKVQELADRADARFHEQLMGQIEINKAEAQHGSIFVAGWRPFIGWASGVGFGYATILQPMLNWVSIVLFDYQGSLPEFDTALLMGTLTGMLGFGGLRTYETLKGVQRKSLQKPV